MVKVIFREHTLNKGHQTLGFWDSRRGSSTSLRALENQMGPKVSHKVLPLFTQGSFYVGGYLKLQKSSVWLSRHGSWWLDLPFTSVSTCMPQTSRDTHELLSANTALTIVSAHQKGWCHQSTKARTLHGLLKAIFTLPAGRLLGAISGQV